MNKDNITKILEGLQGANNVLKTLITPELEASMNKEQLDLLAEARNITGKKNLKEMSLKLEKLNNKIKR